MTCACRSAAAWLSFIWNLNWQLHCCGASSIQGGTMPEHAPSSLQTKGTSPCPPMKTVSSPIFASNFPCCPMSSLTSSRVAPASSTTTNLFPARSLDARILRSASP